MTTNTYAGLSTAAKRAARDIQRTRQVMNLQGSLNEPRKRIKHLEEEKAALAKELAVSEFVHTQGAANNDPRVEDFAKDLEATKKRVESETKQIDKEIASAEKEIKEIEKQIGDVESGEWKVNAERQAELAKELVHARITKGFVDGEYDEGEATEVAS